MERMVTDNSQYYKVLYITDEIIREYFTEWDGITPEISRRNINIEGVKSFRYYTHPKVKNAVFVRFGIRNGCMPPNSRKCVCYMIFEENIELLQRVQHCTVLGEDTGYLNNKHSIFEKVYGDKINDKEYDGRSPKHLHHRKDNFNNLPVDGVCWLSKAQHGNESRRGKGRSHIFKVNDKKELNDLIERL